jgi:hypothetical protein
MLSLFEAGLVEGIYFKLCIGLVSLEQKSLSTKLGTWYKTAFNEETDR